MKTQPLLIVVLGVLVLALWLFQGHRTEKVQQLREQHEAAPTQSATAERTSLPPPDVPQSAGPVAGSAGTDELAELQARVARLEQTLDSVVDSLNAVIEHLDREAIAAQRASQPSWGVNQATGEPDTMAAGDKPTAWAPASPDGDPKWLQLGYEKAVEIAQVRVRESCGPGCIAKVAAVLESGAEVVIWQGRQSPGEGIVDATFNAPAGLTARGVKVYLDTKRVPGWNEIDAVELIGRDGTRQWAQSASASSSYGETGRLGTLGRGNVSTFSSSTYGAGGYDGKGRTSGALKVFRPVEK